MPETVAERPSTREEFRGALLHFINVRLPQLRDVGFRPDVGPDSPLFEPGPIDSLGILHLIAFIEGATGRKLATRMVTMEHFRTVNAICDTFWAESGEGPR